MIWKIVKIAQMVFGIADFYRNWVKPKLDKKRKTKAEKKDDPKNDPPTG